MTVTIIICTRNRAEQLGATLESVRVAAIPPGWAVEQIVVNNGSTDQTGEVIKKAQAHNPLLKCLVEPRAGLSHARNTGLREAQGQVILFTDDDVRVPTDWIKGMCGPIVQGEADAVQGGIKIAPHLERKWLTGSLRVWVAGVEHPTNAPQGLVGANMAFRREAIGVAGNFDIRLGPGAAGFFDDTVFGWALQRAGWKFLYRPEVAVIHHFSPDRLALKSYIRTAARMAWSHALVINDIERSQSAPKFPPVVFQVPGFIFRCVTQLYWLMKDRRPDAGFIVRYYQLRLWWAL
ncbi:MAG: glycosyltransferase family 2 protein [Opitutus sp.]